MADEQLEDRPITEESSAAGRDEGVADSGVPSDCQLPWEYESNAFRGFWRTVFLVCAKRGNLRAYMAGPANRIRAKLFRHCAILVWVVSSLAVVCIMAITLLPSGQAKEFLFGERVFVAVALCVPIILYASTSSVPWFCAPGNLPPERQERTISLSYYASAPLAMSLFLAAVACLCNMRAVARHPEIAAKTLGLLGAVIWLSGLLVALGVMKSVSAGASRRVIKATILLPILWVLLPAAILLVPVALAMWGLLVGTVF